MEQPDASPASDDRDAMEVAAMQFAGGMPAARVAELWDREIEWVEDAIRLALLGHIPKRNGGLKASRSELRAERAATAVRERQQDLEW